jgi:kumamolisin
MTIHRKYADFFSPGGWLIGLVVISTTGIQSSWAQDVPYIPKSEGQVLISKESIPRSSVDFSSLKLSQRDFSLLAGNKIRRGQDALTTVFSDIVAKQPDPLEGTKAYLNTAIYKLTNPRVRPPAVALPAVATTTQVGFVETPGSIACVYGLARTTNSCAPEFAKTPAQGGSANRRIAVVVPFHAKNIANDLFHFSSWFGLPMCNFAYKFASGNPPAGYNPRWEAEATADVEWAHAMAPVASIILVEADDNSPAALADAVETAADEVSKAGGGEVIMSWILDNPSAADVAKFEAIFTKTRSGGGVVFFAASGDNPGVWFPASSPYVVAVGGTTINRDRNGKLLGESPFVGGGAGLSTSADRPSFQDIVSALVSAHRGVVDLSAVANPEMGGVWLLDSNNKDSNEGWSGVGGTSVATAIIAGIVHNAGRFVQSSKDELNIIYGSVNSNGFIDAGKFNDIVANPNLSSRGCGDPLGTKFEAVVGWDFCTGVGTPAGTGGL